MWIISSVFLIIVSIIYAIYINKNIKEQDI